MKKFNQEIRYEGTTAAEVWEMIMDQAFREQVCDYQRVVRRQVTIDSDGTTAKVVQDYAHGAERVPAFAKRFIGDEIAIIQEENWTSPTQATLKLTIPGKPGELTGTVSILESGGGVTETIDGTVKVGIPLVGGKIEDLIAGLIGKAFRAENRVGTKWLAGER